MLKCLFGYTLCLHNFRHFIGIFCHSDFVNFFVKLTVTNYAAKREKNLNESRIRYLEKTIKTAIIISDDSKEDEVGINNTVTIWIPEDEMEETYRIITTIRGNSLKGLISIDSPLGKALIGHKVGDVVSVKVSEDYSYDVEIRNIDKSTDDSQDEIRKF